MSDLPKLGGKYRVRTKSGHEFDAHIVSLDHEFDVWAEVNEGEAPDCWTDGYCWEVNENLEQSDPVVAWRRLS